MHELQQAVAGGQLQPHDVTPGLLHRSMHTAGCPPVDLLLRTSGETRLSDFMLWQASHAHLAFLDVLWPDLSFLHFAKVVLDYQQHDGARQRLVAAAARQVQERAQAEAPLLPAAAAAQACASCGAGPLIREAGAGCDGASPACAGDPGRGMSTGCSCQQQRPQQSCCCGCCSRRGQHGGSGPSAAGAPAGGEPCGCIAAAGTARA